MDRIFIDMDGVLAKWLPEASIEQVTSKGYFLNLPEEENVVKMIQCIQKLQKSMRDPILQIYILSSVFKDDHSIKEKNYWLDKKGINIPHKNRLFCPYGISKSDYIAQKLGLDKSDILIDDYTNNLQTWHGTGIKMYNNCNGTKGTWKGYSVRHDMDPQIMMNQILGIYFSREKIA